MLRSVRRSAKGPALLPLVAALFTLAAACSSGGGSTQTTTPPPETSATTQTTPSQTGSGNAVAITMVDFSFQPATVTASTSQDIVLTNKGAALHNFSIEGTSIDVDVQPGQSQTLTAPGPSFAPGTYTFFCKYHRSSGMTGTLTATAG